MSGSQVIDLDFIPIGAHERVVIQLDDQGVVVRRVWLLKYVNRSPALNHFQPDRLIGFRQIRNTLIG